MYDTSMKWKILDTGFSSAEKNMAIDASLLNEASQPTIHLYDWEKRAATCGYFSKPERILDLGAAAEKGVQLARRPTGGGVLFHFTDLAFSVVIPSNHSMYSTNTLRNYATINSIVEQAVFAMLGSKLLLLEEEESMDSPASHFCMGKPTRYDVMLQGKKVAGAAQRRTKTGLLHQGSIHLALPDWKELSRLIREPAVLDAMRCYSAGLVESKDLPQAKNEMKELLIEKFSEVDA